MDDHSDDDDLVINGDVTNGDFDDKSIRSPNGTKYWIPECEDWKKPAVGMLFGKLDDVFKMYKRYATDSGFEVRKATQTKDRFGTICNKYFVCSKEGAKKKAVFDTLDSVSKKKSRRRPDFRVGCDACIKVHVTKTKMYEIYDFVEKHNHVLVSKDDEFLQRSNRNMSLCHQYFTVKASNSNLGAVKSYNLVKELVGGYDKIGASRVDFKNFSRDMNYVIGDKDAQMIIDKYKVRKESQPNLSFEFCTDEEDKLAGCFWADEVCKANYASFGDVLSFDATFSTNKYSMVFVPFTGVDNHARCITFGVGLLSKETIGNYKWLLEAFLSANGKEPYLILTDQDPAMKQAIDCVFKTACHRLCMWHIMEKLPSKVGTSICEEGGFRQRLHDLVWSEKLEPSNFEELWTSLLEEFKLEDHKWLKKMFGIRETWIPAFFRDIPMSGLMKTTSRSESINFFFGQNSNWQSTLVHFWSRFETSIEKQRHTQRCLDYDTRTTRPLLETPLEIEKHAAEVYTRKVFYLIQKEIVASLWTCIAYSKDVIYDKDEERKGEYQVVFDDKDYSATCSCLQFDRQGILCRHIFYIFRHHDINRIPEQYILKRWRRDSVKLPSVKDGSNVNVECNSILSDLYSEVAEAVHVLGDDVEKLKEILTCVRTKRKELEAVGGGASSKSKKEKIESLLDIREPSEVVVKNPSNIRNKGCGTRKRYVSAREESFKKMNSKRRCRACGEVCNHDSRNCPSGKKQS